MRLTMCCMYQAMKLSPELVSENMELLLDMMPLRQQWTPEATFHRLGGLPLLTQLVALSCDWGNYTGK